MLYRKLSNVSYVRCQRNEPLTITLNIFECKVRNISKKNSASTFPKGRFSKEAGVHKVGNGTDAGVNIERT
jgi:hypothetical protein